MDTWASPNFLAQSALHSERSGPLLVAVSEGKLENPDLTSLGFQAIHLKLLPEVVQNILNGQNKAGSSENVGSP